MPRDPEAAPRERQITFLVTLPASQDPVVIATARDREGAKRLARPVLGHDPDRYIVQPLTREGADVRFLWAETIEERLLKARNVIDAESSSHNTWSPFGV